MANEKRVRFNFASGTLSGSLTNVATSMSSAGLANLGVIDATNFAAIVIENEIVWVTAHTAAATTATIVRGQEGTVAAAHNSGVAWQHGPTAVEFSYLNPPACRVYHNAAQSIANATATALAFNSERFDTDSMHSTSSLTSRITFNTAGLYVVSLHIEWPTQGVGERYAFIWLNAATKIAFNSVSPAQITDTVGQSFATVWKFIAGDYIEAWVYQTSTAALNINSASATTPEFAAVWVGTGY